MEGGRDVMMRVGWGEVLGMERRKTGVCVCVMGL